MTVSAGDDLRWMRRALRLASLSAGMTWPNPGVGCVLVRDGIEIGSGRHRRCGDLHGETSAIADATARGQTTTGATAYVTLAPCTRHGRQPPCIEALIRAGLKRVVAAVADPHQDDAAHALRAAGIAYHTGIGAHEAQHLHGGFLQRIRTGRPRFTGKWAMSLDGSIAAADGNSRWISSPEALALSRRRRRAFDGILVGAGTIRSDAPTLLSPAARTHGDQRGPARIILAGRSSLALPAALTRDARSTPVIVVHPTQHPDWPRWADMGCTLVEVADTRQLNAVAKALGQHGFNDVLVEGGAAIHSAFLNAHLYDRLELYLGSLTLMGGTPVTTTESPLRSINDADHWVPEQPPRLVGTTVLQRWQLEN